MRLLGLEIKRIIKTPLTIIMLLAALCLSIALAYIPVTFEHAVKDYDGDTPNYVHGMDAIRLNKERLLQGKVTQDEVVKIIESYQATLVENNVNETYELPNKVYDDNFGTFNYMFPIIQSAYSKGEGNGADLNYLNIKNLPDFYESADECFEAKLMQFEGDYPSAVEKAEEMRSNVKKPYEYYYGITANAMDYETLVLVVILLCCTVAIAPVFSSEYQTGSDCILRCTKKGRTNLAVVKIAASLIIVCAWALVCLLTWIGLVTAFFGVAGMKTSVQLLANIYCMLSISVGQLMWVHAGIGLLLCICSICFTLFVSAKSKNNVQSMALSLLTCFLPLIMYVALPGRIADTVKCFLPSGGIGLQNSVLYDLVGINFFHIGSASIWTPYFIMIVAIIEAVLFATLGIRKYKKHV